MNYAFLDFWGVPCCERFSKQKTERALAMMRQLLPAQSPVAADLLFIFGRVTNKQVPYLQNLWADCSYPAHCIHLRGCKAEAPNYALVDNLDDLIAIDVFLEGCVLDEAMLEAALKALRTKAPQ